MSDMAGRYMKQAAAQLQALDGTLSRACEGAEGFRDEALVIQEMIREAARLAAELAPRMRGEST